MVCIVTWNRTTNSQSKAAASWPLNQDCRLVVLRLLVSLLMLSMAWQQPHSPGEVIHSGWHWPGPARWQREIYHNQLEIWPCVATVVATATLASVLAIQLSVPASGEDSRGARRTPARLGPRGHEKLLDENACWKCPVIVITCDCTRGLTVLAPAIQNKAHS